MPGEIGEQISHRTSSYAAKDQALDSAGFSLDYLAGKDVRDAFPDDGLPMDPAVLYHRGTLCLSISATAGNGCRRRRTTAPFNTLGSLSI